MKKFLLGFCLLWMQVSYTYGMPNISWPSSVKFHSSHATQAYLDKQRLDISTFEVKARLVDFLVALSPRLPEPSFYQVIPKGMRISGVDKNVHWVISLYEFGHYLWGQFSTMHVTNAQLRLPDWLLPQGELWMSVPGVVHTWLISYPWSPPELEKKISAWLRQTNWHYIDAQHVWLKNNQQLNLSVQTHQNGSMLYAHLSQVENE